MVYNKETYNDDILTNEQQTARTQSEKANTMDENIQFTWDSSELKITDTFRFWISS